MQTFIDSKTQKVYAFEDDVVATLADGVYSFTTAGGDALDNLPTTLAPYTPQGPTAAQILAQVQAAQVSALTAACAAAMVAGFSSSALGAAYTYPSQPIDQANLTAVVTASQSPGLPAGWTVSFWCADSAGKWAMRPHTPAQIQQVLADGVKAREALSLKLVSLSAKVATATTKAAVLKVTW